MMQALSIALLFIFSLFAEASFFTSVGAPFSSIPFLFLVGIVVMHRSDISYGAAWFTLSAFLLPLLSQDTGIRIAYLAVAITGTLLMMRIFTNRSAYALLGLGSTLYLEFGVIRLLFGATFEEVFYGFVFAMIGIYLGSAVARFTERYTKQLFIIR